MIKVLITIINISLVLGFSCKQDYKSSITVLVDESIIKDHFSGIIEVYKDNQLLFSKASGFADFGTNRQLDVDTPFKIGSVTKTFTAVSIMILAERRQLTLSDKISKFLPDLPQNYSGVSIKQLLSHTSGIPDYLDYYPTEIDSLKNKDVLRALKSKNYLYFMPDAEFKYSNSGYVLLALIIESISKQTYQDFVKQNILDSLHMNSTFFFEPSDSLKNTRALSYDSTGHVWEIPLVTQGDGGIVSTSRDLYKWYKGLMDNKIVSDSIFNYLVQPNVFENGKTIPYGLGFEIFRTKLGFYLVGHRGGLGGIGVIFLFEPEGDNCIIAMTNNDCRKTEELVEKISMTLHDFNYRLNK
jgi:CubicO group peptidase (beta-lactamase class C family)